MANLALLAPLAVQLVHLFIADVLWIGVVLLAVEASRNGEYRSNDFAVQDQFGSDSGAIRSAALESSPQ